MMSFSLVHLLAKLEFGLERQITDSKESADLQKFVSFLRVAFR